MIFVEGIFYLTGVLFWIWGLAMLCCLLYFAVFSILMIPVAILEGLGNLWDWIWKGRKA